MQSDIHSLLRERLTGWDNVFMFTSILCIVPPSVGERLLFYFKVRFIYDNLSIPGGNNAVLSSFFFVDGTREAAGTTSRVKLNYRYIYSVFLDVLRSRDAGSLILFASC